MADPKALVLSFPPSDISSKDFEKAIGDYIKALERIPVVFWGDDDEKQAAVFDLLNPSVHTIPYLFALKYHVKTGERRPDRHEYLLGVASLFFSSFDPRQVRYVSDEFASVLAWFFDAFENSLDLSPLTAAILRLDPTAGTFTIFHLRVLRLALRNRVPSQARAILDKDIYAFAQSPTKNVPQEVLGEEMELSNTFISAKSFLAEAVRSHHVLEYYLLGAIVYIGSRNFSRARLFLEYILLSPTHQHVVSVIQIEAFKKWILVGLLTQGKLYSLPRTIDQSLLRTIKAFTKAYEALADAANNKNWRKYHAEVDAGQHIWLEDGNQETVRQVGIALQQYLVLDLQKTFAALPISRVTKHIGSATPDTISLVTAMIADGQLNAKLDEEPNVADGVALRFLDPAPSNQKVLGHQDDLEARTKRIKNLVTYIQDADRRIQLTREYVEHRRRQKRAAQGPDGDLTEQMDLSWDASLSTPIVDDGDEDIMAT